MHGLPDRHPAKTILRSPQGWNIDCTYHVPYREIRNVKREIDKAQLNTLELGEMRWKEDGDYICGDIRVIYVGGKESQRGVAVLSDKETNKSGATLIQHSDRLLLVNP